MQGDFRLGDWLVQPSLGRVSRAGATAHLRAKVMDLLVFLAQRPGDVVSKDALLNGVWGTEFISESALTRVVTELRQALGDEVDHPQILETIPKRGYRLIAPVEPPAREAVAAVAAVSSARGPSDSVAEGFSPAFAARHRWLWTAALVMVLAAAALVVTRPWADSAGTWPTSVGRGAVKSVAVVPLRNLTGDAGQDWFAEAITEELTSALSQVSALRVISGVSARRYKGSDKTAVEIARELGGIEVLLGGSVKRDGDRVRIGIYLDEVAGSRRVWAQTYDRPLGDSLALFDEVARRVAQEVAAAVTTPEEARLTRARAVKPEAYEEYLRGLYFRDRQLSGGCVQAERYFLQAIATDAGFAQPHAALAFCYGANKLNGRLPSADALARGHAEVARALDLDEHLADAHVSLALIRHRTEYDWASAERSFRRALALNPSHPEALVRYGEWLYMSGRVEEGLAMVRQGVALAPFSVDYRIILGYALYNLRGFGDAVDEYEKAREFDPNRPMAMALLADSLGFQRRYDEAVAEQLLALRLTLVPDRMATATEALEVAYQRRGWEGFWREELELFKQEVWQPGTVWQLPDSPSMMNWSMARRYARLGERDRAIASLEAAYAAREGNLVCLNVEPLFDVLRSDPRFQDLVRRVGLRP